MNLSPTAHEVPTGAEQGADPLLPTLLRVAHGLQERLKAALREVGLSRPRYEALDQLARAGGALSLKALAEGQRCAPSNVTQLVDRLVGEGLVCRLDDPDDRRSRIAELTAEGAERAVAGRAAVERVQEDFARSLSAVNRAALASILQEIR